MSGGLPTLQVQDFQQLTSEPTTELAQDAYSALQREAAGMLGMDNAVRDVERLVSGNLNQQLKSFAGNVKELEALAAALRVLEATVQAMGQARDSITTTLLNNPGLMMPGIREQMLLGVERRRSILSTIPHVDSKVVAKLINSTAGNVAAAAARLKAKREIFSVTAAGSQELFPAYQFDPKTGMPRPEIKQTIEAFPDGTSGWELAFWFYAPNGYLNGARPCEHLLVDSKAVATAAKHANEPLDY